MTVPELSQILDLEKEMRVIEDTISDLRRRSAIDGRSLIHSSSSHSKARQSSIDEYLTRTEELTDHLLRLRSAAQNKRMQLVSFIEAVPDSLTRQALILKFMRGYSWTKTALEIGGGNTAEGVRTRVRRAVKAHPVGPK